MVSSCDKCMSDAVTFIRYSGAHLCERHFMDFVEKRVRKDLKKQIGDRRWKGRLRVAVALSGGKDSTIALAILNRMLSRRREADLVAVLIDEGIEGYRPVTMEHAERTCKELGVPLFTGSFKTEYGITMDDIASRSLEKGPCTYCGVLRRWLLNVMARDLEADYLATGLNLDDTTQSILMNMARGDVEKLARLGPHSRAQKGLVPRIQPLRVIPEKESYLYAIVKGLGFGDPVCPYAAGAERNRYRKIIFDLEDDSPGTRYRILQSYEEMKELLRKKYKPAKLQRCGRCNEPTIKQICEACSLIAKAMGDKKKKA